MVNFVVLIHLTSATDRQTDRQTDERTDGLAVTYTALEFRESHGKKKYGVAFRSYICLSLHSTAAKRRTVNLDLG